VKSARVRHLLPAVDAITENTRQAVVLFSTNILPSFDIETIEKFNNTYAAHVFGLLRTHLSLSLVLAVSRIWDITEGAQSVPNLLPQLKHEKVIAAIIGRRKSGQFAIFKDRHIENREHETAIRAALLQMAIKDAERTERETRKAACDLIKRIENFMGGDRITPLINLRHKAIAHSLEITHLERHAYSVGNRIMPVKVGDLERALRDTIKIVTDLNILIRDLHVSLDNAETIWRRYSQDFWGRFSGEPKGRGFMARRPKPLRSG
jgi:hypothetical protein